MSDDIFYGTTCCLLYDARAQKRRYSLSCTSYIGACVVVCFITYLWSKKPDVGHVTANLITMIWSAGNNTAGGGGGKEQHRWEGYVQ